MSSWSLCLRRASCSYWIQFLGDGKFSAGGIKAVACGCAFLAALDGGSIALISSSTFSG